MAKRRLKRFLFCRHAEFEESVMTREERVLAQGDTALSPLTARGLDQAALLGEWIREKWSGQAPDTILYSPYVRTKMTAATALPEYVERFQEEPLLRELNRGLWYTELPETIEECFPGETERRKREKWRYRFPSGESFVDMRNERVIPFQRELEEGKWGEYVIAFGHSWWHLAFEQIRAGLTYEHTWETAQRKWFAAHASLTTYHVLRPGKETILCHDPFADYVVPWGLAEGNET